ncbi:nucleoside hydrolase [Consotaella salsifontis]|uniref:Purine nucleosidase n=1 Tax=Consotaella salsifontis TaxID=1365950 RepID=A0A1T4MPS1_9HYPH|nr:nucleoside hydrolase [Consotaella salsifontis]SJZ69022.1 purine nucleosidase [Consotaella salsifontis]
MGVWIDTDMGFDDIAAILVVEAGGEAIDGVSLVFGNSELTQVCANAAGAQALFGWRFPIHAGRESAVLGAVETAARILGQTGIPTAERTLPVVATEFTDDAFEALCRWLSSEGEHRILALGPLTNIAALALARPDLAARITHLTWMGGGLTRGNHTASAEFNALADPEALAIVLAAAIPFTMVDLDFCRKVLAYPDDVAAIRAGGGAAAETLADLLAGFIDIATSRGRAGMSLYDAVAAFAFTRPDEVEFREARIEVELAGALTRGRTVVDARPGARFNARFAAGLDADAARSAILGALHQVAAR